MIISTTIEEVREHRWQDATVSWGFVPTMGYLHDGHLSLVRRANKENTRVAVSIFVNPTQFGPNEDLNNYPRNLQQDLLLLEKSGTDLVFVPDNEVIYPADFQTSVVVSGVSTPLEGKSRPHHFQGVSTVVSKLFNIIQPTRVYFGQKDAQQVVVIHQLVRDLNFNLEVVVCPIVRESDGLAMSSRNVRLSPENRADAPILFEALSRALEELNHDERDGNRLRQLMREIISTKKTARLEYASVADPTTLRELQTVDEKALLSLAAFFGPVRLIDNMLWSNPDR